MQKYTAELKAQIVKEVTETRNIMLVARNHKLNHKTVWNWVNNSKNKGKVVNQKKVRELEKKLFETQAQVKILEVLLKKTNLVLYNDLKLQESALSVS